MEQENTNEDNWVCGCMTVRFDIEEGQVVDEIDSKMNFPDCLKKLISYFSFPDSYVQRPENDLAYSFQISFDKKPLHCYVFFSQRKDANSPRGFFQKSFLLFSRIHLVTFFNSIVTEAGKLHSEGIPIPELTKAINSNTPPKQFLEKKENQIFKIIDKEISKLKSIKFCK